MPSINVNIILYFFPSTDIESLKGDLDEFVEQTIRMPCQWSNIEILEMSIKEDHNHLIISVSPRLSASEGMGMLKTKIAIKILKSFPFPKKKPYWRNYFWNRGYCVSIIGLDETKIRKM